MPCGGIYPVGLKDVDSENGNMLLPGAQRLCLSCGGRFRPNDDYVYFCEEWDCWIHRECVHEFIQSAEGKVTLSHGHAIELNAEDTRKYGYINE